MKIKVRGDRMYPMRDAAMQRTSKVRPYRDEERADDPNYVMSLPPAPAGRAYVARDGGAGRLQLALAHEGDPDQNQPGDEEEIQGVDLPPGSYHAVSAYDGAMHIYRRAADEGEEQLPPVANNGSPPLDDLPARLTAQNKANDSFWRKQYADDAPHSAPPNARAIASAIAAARNDPGTRDGAMLMQRANRALNELNRSHYAGQQDRPHETPRPKGFATPAQINQKNRQRWGGAGRQ